MLELLPVREKVVIELIVVSGEHHRPGMIHEHVKELYVAGLIQLLAVLSVSSGGEEIGWICIDQHLRLMKAPDQIYCWQLLDLGILEPACHAA